MKKQTPQQVRGDNAFVVMPATVPASVVPFKQRAPSPFADHDHVSAE